MNNKVELLAPAGSPACALAALEAGADAIYAGLAKFNARERGENFTPDMMGRVIELYHKHNKKVYVTFNTLLKETEIPAAFEQLSLLNQLQPDALLVQDLGVLRMAKRYFPRLVLHGSTQMGFHNSAGLKVAEQLGLSRVVLERQVTLEELELMKKESDIEIEVFIHGALCCSLSGSCYFSSYLGGYSGNRGKCKQPCRRRYFSPSGNGFFFSPQDLCAMEQIPALRRLGVASFKIEGRLRQSDYVTAAVSAYRLLMDAPDEEFAAKIPEARRILSTAGGRRWSHGFYTSESAKSLIRPDAIGSAGQLCGSVEAVRENGFGFTASKRLFIGDRLRVQPDNGDEGPAMTMTKFFVENMPATKVLPGQRVFVCCDKAIPERGQIFKLGSTPPDYSAKLAALPPRRERIDLKIELTRSKITVTPTNALLKPWEKALELSDAKKHATTAETVAEEFRASDSAEWAAGQIECTVEPGIFLPASELKNLRRSCWDDLKDELAPALLNSSGAEELEAFRKEYQKLQKCENTSHVVTAAVKPHGAEPADRKTVRAMDVFEFDSITREVILPEFMAENRLLALKKAIDRAYTAGIRNFRITSLYALELLKPLKDIHIIASMPLPVCNSQAVLALQELGVDRALAHIELDKESLEALREKSVLALELYRLGRPSLLVSRAALPIEGHIHDARQQQFVVRTDHRSGLSRIYPEKIHSVPRMPGFLDFYDLRNANWNPENCDTFNFERDWM